MTDQSEINIYRDETLVIVPVDFTMSKRLVVSDHAMKNVDIAQENSSFLSI